jgi:putative ABC transport system substrate-binding protein
VSFFAGPEIVGKALQLVGEAVPGVRRVAVLRNPANALHPLFVKEAEAAARLLRVQVRTFEAGGADAFEQAFEAMSREQVGALVVLADGMFYVQRAGIAELAARHRLPAIYGQREHVEAGGMMAYGPGLADRFRGREASRGRSSREPGPPTSRSSSRRSSSW